MDEESKAQVSNLSHRILKARERIKKYIRKTPLEFSPFLSNLTPKGPKVYLKLESEQITGSFKARGAFNKLCLMCEESSKSKETGAISASTGNHALACTVASETLGIPVRVYAPETISSSKRAMLYTYNTDLVVSGKDCVQTETTARTTAQDEGLPYISPYNDLDVACGQGSIAVEIYEELGTVDAVLVSVGGGGLISGIATYLKHVNPNIQVIGCQPELSKVMYESVKAGEIIFEESGDTLSDGTAGGVENDAVTFDLCKKYVDDWILVSEEDIAKAIYYILDKHHKVIEGSAGVAVAAYMKNRSKFMTFKHVVILICGCNISTEKFAHIINSNSDANIL